MGVRYFRSTGAPLQGGSTTTGALGTVVSGANFGNLTQMPGLFGYVIGVILRVSGTLTQGSATAVLTKQEISNIISSLTLQFGEENWCASVSGRALTNYLCNTGIASLAAKRANFIQDADFANDTNDHALLQYYLLPLAPGMYRETDDSEEDLSGAVPFWAAMNKGQLSYSIVSTLTSAWAVKTATNLTVTCYPEVVYTDQPITWVRTHLFEQSKAAGEDQFDLPGSGKRTIDLATVHSTNYATAFTGAASPMLNVDGIPVQQLVPGDHLNGIAAMRGYAGAASLNWDDGNIIIAQESPSTAGFITGSKFQVANWHQTHAAAAKYIVHDFRQPTALEMQDDLAQTKGVGEAVAAEVAAEYVSPASASDSRLRAKNVPASFALKGGAAKANRALGGRAMVVTVD